MFSQLEFNSNNAENTLRTLPTNFHDWPYVCRDLHCAVRLKTKVFLAKTFSHQSLRMDPNKCQVLTTKGTQCSKKHKSNSAYCGLHETKREDTGPHRFAMEQLTIKHKFERSKHIGDFQQRRTEAQSPRDIHAITNEETLAEAHMTVRHRTETQDLRDAQAAEIAANGGRDPDQPARDNRELTEIRNNAMRCIQGLNTPRQWNVPVLRNQYLAALARYMETLAALVIQHQGNDPISARIRTISTTIQIATDEFQARILLELDGGVVPGWGGQAIAPAQRLGARAMALPNPNVLARIANDNQNVHTELVVNQTKKNVAEILKIPVPEHFKWQRNRLSQTYKMIILFCHLSPKSAWQFSAMYCSDATIYDLEPGIFGKVVDGVWQYIRNSPDKADLKKILSAELRDNIGMCAQGNLSRMCNVLQGYLDGIEQKESVNTILGREFSKLMEIADETERVITGMAILRGNAVPEDQWETWLEPLRS